MDVNPQSATNIEQAKHTLCIYKFAFPEDPMKTGDINWGESIGLKLRKEILIKDTSCKKWYRHLREMYCGNDTDEVVSPQALQNLWRLKLRPKTRQRVWRILINRIPRKIDPTRNPHDQCACGKGKARIRHLFSECKILKGIAGKIGTYDMIEMVQTTPETNLKYNRKALTPETGLKIRIYCTLLQTQWLSYCNWVKQGVDMNIKNGLKTLTILVKKEAATDKGQEMWAQIIKNLEQMDE
ncbi:hypothetical protein SeLEV6574_g03918 [Synchytrium endobioticum]|uniref:Reverse transcriptase zinc-binding domain-containing protein n=1 Tax=Synchytrium endobioticum TaxID=286115 RepID=A0A507D1H5_9FUNG|nr:hypothetical protein SeLEV6574_g03918 [Synchytrium endobioticum]